MAPEDKHFSSSSVACSGSEWNDPPGTENMREIFQILFLRSCNIAEVPVAGPGSAVLPLPTFHHGLGAGDRWTLGIWVAMNVSKSANGKLFTCIILYCKFSRQFSAWLRWPSFPQLTALCMLSEPKILNLHESFVQ